MAQEPSSKGGASTVALSATYSSPENQPFTVTREIPSNAAANGAVSDLDRKTRHLQELRAAISAVQEQVNKELTARMEEDKTRDAAAAAVGAVASAEAKEEENYGEEVQEEDD